MKLTLLRCALITTAIFGLHTRVASAVTLSYTGNLRSDATFTACGTGCTLGPSNSDGDFAQYAAAVKNIAVGESSTLTALTFGFGGGVNAAGTTIAAGGFEPYLSLFDSAGHFLSSTYFGVTCPSGANTSGGFCYDVLLDGGTLSAGTYSLAISAYLNQSFAENNGAGLLSDGFTGLGNLYPGENLNYAVDVTLTPAAITPVTPVPEPPTFILVGLTSAMLLALKQRHALSHSM